MLRSTAARGAGGVVLVVTLTFLAFALFATTPLDDESAFVATGLTAEEAREERRQLGLDQPLVDQWGRFVWDLSTHATLGRTFSGIGGGQPVTTVLVDALPATLSLAIGGFVLAFLLAVPLGTISALRRGSFPDRAIFLFTVVGVVLHPFVVGLLLKDVVAERFGLAPESTYCPLSGERAASPSGGEVVCGGPIDWLSHLWLPWLTFGLFFLPIYTRLVRARVIENLGEQYVLTARAKGASERRIVTRHVARNALGPIVAMLALDIGTLVVAAIYVETIFGLNGLGLLVSTNLSGAVGGYDRNVLVGVVVVVAVAITLANIASDAILRASDPRLRVGRIS